MLLVDLFVVFTESCGQVGLSCTDRFCRHHISCVLQSSGLAAGMYMFSNLQSDQRQTSPTSLWPVMGSTVWRMYLVIPGWVRV